jgi:hypothetical protein
LLEGGWGDAEGAGEPAGQVALVGEAHLGGDLGDGPVEGEQMARGPQPELPLIVAW